MTSTSGGFNVGPSAHSYNPYGIPPTSSTIMPSEQKTQRWNPYINGQNAYITTPMSQYLPNQQATTPLHSTTCTTMKCTHCQKDFCLPVNTISASYSQLPSASTENNGLVCSIPKALPSRVGKSSDVRYRSFHNFNQSSSSKQCPQHGALYNKGKSRASLALPHPATYAMNSMSFADGISKAGGSISMNSNGCDGNHLFQSNSSIVHSFAPPTKQKFSNRNYESFGETQNAFINQDQCALCSVSSCQYIPTPCSHPSCVDLNPSYCPSNPSSSLYMNNPLNGHGHGSYYYSPHHACSNGTTSASTFDLRPPLQPHHKYGTQYQSGNIPLRNSNDCDGTKNKHLCHGVYTPGVTNSCDQEQQTRSKSIRWTKDQLRKIDKVDINRNNSFTKNQTGSCSSSSQGTITDDSGIHSGNTFNTNDKDMEGSNNSSPSINAQYRDSEKDQQSSGMFGGLGRSQATRRPIRKLPNVPGVNSKQAHIVNLPSLISSSKSVERKSTRTLPSLPANLFSSSNKNSQKTDGSNSKGNITSNDKQNNKSNKEVSHLTQNNDSGGWIKSTTRLSNFFRSVKFSRSKKLDPQPQLTRVFGMDLNDLVVSTGKEVPDVLVQCTTFIEKHGLVDGVYRISGISSNIKRLKVMFDSGTQPKSMEKEEWIMRDVHCVPSLIKQFFRELPNSPLHYGGNVTRISINNGSVTSSEKKPDQKHPSEASNFITGAPNINSTCNPNYEMFRNAAAAASRNSDKREALKQFKSALNLLTKAQFNTLRHLMLHLNKLSEKVSETGMTAKNLSIVWAPNLLRTPLSIHTGCETGFGGVSIKLNGQNGCSNGNVVSKKNSNNLTNKTIIHQDSRGNGTYNCAAAAEQHSKLQLNLIQNTHVIQCLIENAKWLFSNEERSIVSENKNGFASLIMPPYPSSSSVAAKKSYGGSNTQILQMQPKYEEREIKFKTAAMPSSVSTSHINKQPPPTFLERVRYIQPATKQIPLSKRYTASLTTDMNENEEPMMMMNSIPHNGNGYIGSTNYLPQNFTTNVQYIPDTLAKPPFNTPFMREASQRHSRNYNPAQNVNQTRFIQSRGEGNIADHYFNYHQNNQHQMDPGYHNHNIKNQYMTSVYQKPMMENTSEQTNKHMNHPSKGNQNQQHSCCHSERKLVEIDGLSTQCRQKGDVSLVHLEENESSSDEEKVMPHTVRIDTASGRLLNGVQNGFANSRISSARFSRNNSTSNKIGIAAKFCRPRPKSMDAEVLKNLERNCQNLILESKKDKNRSLSDNEDTSSDGENTTLGESSDIFQEKDIDQLMEEQRRISGNNC